MAAGKKGAFSMHMLDDSPEDLCPLFPRRAHPVGLHRPDALKHAARWFDVAPEIRVAVADCRFDHREAGRGQGEIIHGEEDARVAFKLELKLWKDLFHLSNHKTDRKDGMNATL